MPVPWPKSNAGIAEKRPVSSHSRNDGFSGGFDPPIPPLDSGSGYQSRRKRRRARARCLQGRTYPQSRRRDLWKPQEILLLHSANNREKSAFHLETEGFHGHNLFRTTSGTMLASPVRGAFAKAFRQLAPGCSQGLRNMLRHPRPKQTVGGPDR